MLWIPGPTEVRPEILAECARPAIGHRSAAMGELLARCDAHLPHAFGLEDYSDARYALATTSASGLMEAALRGAGSRVLCVVNGAFSQRWFEIAQSLGMEAVALEVPWGEAVDDGELADVLDREGPFDALTVVSNETSTGVYTELRPIANVLQAFPDVLFLVDTVSLLAGAAVDFDENGVDFMLAGSQKALACPPGLSVFCASSDWSERAAATPNRGWYLDALRILDGHAARKPPTTPAIPIICALAKQLEDISAGVTLPDAERTDDPRANWEARYAVHVRMRDRTIDWGAEHGCEPFAVVEATQSPTVSCLRSGSVDVDALRAGLLERGFEISAGYGPLKGETFRIGHMGDHTEDGLSDLLAAADAVLG